MGVARRFAVLLVVGAISTIGLTAAFAAPAGADTTGFTVIGNLFAPTTCQLARIDLNTGVLAPFGPTDASHCVFDLTIAADGTLYGVLVKGTTGSGGTAHLLRFDTTTGAATDLGQVGAFVLNGPGNVQGNLTFDAAGNLLVYLVPQTAQGSCPAITNFCLFRVNPANPGSATALGPVPQTFDVYFGLATSPSGTLSSVRDSLGAGSLGSTTSPTTTTTTKATTTTTTLPGVHASAGSWPPVHAAVGPAQTLTVVNGSNGSTTDVGTGTGTPFTVSLDYDSAGTLWAVGFPNGLAAALSSNVITIDPGTGIATLGPAITSGGTPVAVMALAIPRPAAAVVVQPRFTG
ncbi:MAG TPA: hypothetical protein VLV81_13690 [Acidimicrobiia bacterium]|nr:hypothetical protein [Acidimicrobiia bacterium]